MFVINSYLNPDNNLVIGYRSMHYIFIVLSYYVSLVMSLSIFIGFIM
jgi:hypothetical protein